MLCISGTRNATQNHKELIISKIDEYIQTYNITHILVGDCRGVDYIVRQHYKNSDIVQIKIFTADWNRFGKSAGPIRNREMIKQADFLIAFPDNNSRGTISAINIANELEVPVEVIHL